MDRQGCALLDLQAHKQAARLNSKGWAQHHPPGPLNSFYPFPRIPPADPDGGALSPGLEDVTRSERSWQSQARKGGGRKTAKENPRVIGGETKIVHVDHRGKGDSTQL